MLNAYEEQPHIDGLQWIAICVQRGQGQAGAAPVPRKWCRTFLGIKLSLSFCLF